MDFQNWLKHINHVVEQDGQWVGLLDEEGWPILGLPPVISLNATESKLSAESVECVVPLVGGAGRRVADELVAEDVLATDKAGRLLPAVGATRLLAVIRAGERRVFTVTHCVAEGEAVPSSLTIHGVELLDGLASWPCPSVPVVWSEVEYGPWSTDASGVEYERERQLAQVQFATRADGYTKKGPAVTVIRELVQDSFDAVNALHGWDTPHAVVEFSAGSDESKPVLIRGDDSTVWDTISEPARSAGVGVQVDLWWPGDPKVRVRTDRETGATALREWDVPMQVVRVEVVD